MAVRCEGKKRVRNSPADSKDRGGMGRGAPRAAAGAPLRPVRGSHPSGFS